MRRAIPQSSTEGWVYVLDNQMGHYKIGKSTDLTNRIRSLKIQLPFPVIVAYVFRDENCHEAERALHKLFAGKRKNGEWFGLDSIHDLGLVMELANWTGWYEIAPNQFVRDALYKHPYVTRREEGPSIASFLEFIEEMPEGIFDGQEDEEDYPETAQCDGCSQHDYLDEIILCPTCNRALCGYCYPPNYNACSECGTQDEAQSGKEGEPCQS